MEKNYDLWPGGPNAYIPWDDMARVIANSKDFGSTDKNPVTISYYYAKQGEDILHPLKVAADQVAAGTHEWYVKDNVIGIREIKE